MVWLWGIVIIAAVVIELVSVELVSIWFAFGAIVAFILSLCHVPEYIQVIVFLVVSLLLLLSLRTIFMKLLKNNKEKTNIDSVVGKVVTLQKQISEDEPGEVKINGVIWRAVSNGESIDANEKVKIVEVQGNKFLVELVKKEN